MPLVSTRFYVCSLAALRTGPLRIHSLASTVRPSAARLHRAALLGNHAPLSATRRFATCRHIAASSSGGDRSNLGSGSKGSRSARGGAQNSSTSSSSSNADGGDKNSLRCPKCGDPCSHVETFVCKCFSVEFIGNQYKPAFFASNSVDSIRKVSKLRSLFRRTF